ncbi:hypothetical protein [Gordonia rubripertincta]|uniref:hypothetical protein n=1 Tax=Gordonia rubripertincta TaxID=36822 RepID=UPI0015FA65E4|nr:hypothetical protein [Gordonia rubripertincta]QMU19329.1 hypothetical protein H3V45_14645 [Gordonia rubripertincta]
MSLTLEGILEDHTPDYHMVGDDWIIWCTGRTCVWEGSYDSESDAVSGHFRHIARTIREHWHLTVIRTGRRGCRCAHCDDEPIMHLCAMCGNKRCPKAKWHGYQCNNSNDLDQVARLEVQ